MIKITRKTATEQAEWMLVGIVLLLTVKYLILGLDEWDAILHPGRTEDPTSPFLRPLLGIFG